MKVQKNDMGNRKMLPLLLSMSFPPMISMLIQALYNIVDSMFVARISNEALTAVSLIFPIQNVALAIGVGFGIGICACIAQSVGAKNQAETDSAAIHGLIYSIVHSAILLVVGLFLTKPFLRLFTTNAEILQMGTEYGILVICWSFPIILHCYIDKIFQAVGNMIAPMLVQGIGAIINIVLDPIMIFGLFGCPAMGVRGAAIATNIGQVVSCIIAIVLFMRSSTGIRLSMKGFRFNWSLTKRIYTVAIPSTMMMLMPSILVTTLNRVLVSFSDAAVNVLGLYMKLQSFIYMPSNGIIQGMRPIISFNYGANNKKRMHSAIRCSMGLTGGIMAMGTILFLLFPTQIFSIFNSDPQLIQIGRPALQIISLGFVISTVGIVLSGAFEALGKGGHSLLVSLTRQLIIIVPLSHLLVKVVGLSGIWITFPIAESLSAVIAIFFYTHLMKKMKVDEPHYTDSPCEMIQG